MEKAKPKIVPKVLLYVLVVVFILIVTVLSAGLAMGGYTVKNAKSCVWPFKPETSSTICICDQPVTCKI
jgi:hypothetical protein